MDTDDEIEALKNQEKKDYDADTDVEEDSPKPKVAEEKAEDSDEIYNADTDIDEDSGPSPEKKRKSTNHLDFPDLDGVSKKKERKDTSGIDFPKLPEVFKRQKFFIHGNLSDSKRKSLERMIVAGGGESKNYMGPDVDFILTKSSWNSDFDAALESNPKVQFLRPKYVKEKFLRGDFIQPEDFAITPSWLQK